MSDNKSEHILLDFSFLHFACQAEERERERERDLGKVSIIFYIIYIYIFGYSLIGGSSVDSIKLLTHTDRHRTILRRFYDNDFNVIFEILDRDQ